MSHRIKTTLGNRLFSLAISDDADPGEVEDLIVDWEAADQIDIGRLAWVLAGYRHFRDGTYQHLVDGNHIADPLEFAGELVRRYNEYGQ